MAFAMNERKNEPKRQKMLKEYDDIQFGAVLFRNGVVFLDCYYSLSLLSTFIRFVDSHFSFICMVDCNLALIQCSTEVECALNAMLLYFFESSYVRPRSSFGLCRLWLLPYINITHHNILSFLCETTKIYSLDGNILNRHHHCHCHCRHHHWLSSTIRYDSIEFIAVTIT